MPEWTPEQLCAITHRGKDMLVSAAAGSGKTAVLVERIARIIEDGADIDDFLIVTFSRAAASDMRDKLARQFEARAEGDARFREQLDHMERASISTIHAFCIDVLREHFESAGIDPAFRVLDAAEESLLFDRALESTLEEAYGQNDARLSALDFGRGTRRVGELIAALYNFSRQRADPDGWLRAALLSAPQDGEMWTRRLCAQARAVTDEARVLILAALDFSRAPLGPSKYEDALRDDLSRIDALSELSYDALVDAARAFSLTRLPPLRVKDDDPDYEARVTLKEQAGALRKDAKDRVVKLGEKLINREEGLNDLERDAPARSLLYALITDFGARLWALKAEKSALSFNDLEHAALGALRDERVARSLSARYAHVFVDEYQDVSDLQEAVLRRVARPGGLFMVGDVKQSIYRFRQAEPTLFIDKYDRYGRGEDGELVTLGRNFRSRAGVLDFVNRVFERAMNGPNAEIRYDEQARLAPGAAFAGDDPPVEVYVVCGEGADDEPETEEDDAADDDRTGVEREAYVAARRIGQLIGKPFCPAGGPARTLRPGDFAVLCRTRTGVLAAERALRETGIPCFADVREGYFGALEVRIARSLLRLIENRRRDFPLVEVLRSPIVNLTSTQMAAIRAAHKEGSFREACLAYLDAGDDIARALGRLEDQLDRWRMLSGALPLPQWLGLVLEESGYYAYAGAMPGGRLRQINLDALCTYAARYEDAQGGALTGFLAYLEQIEEGGGDAGAACVLPDNDVARAMTAHKSKGLEFPVVICLQTGRRLTAKRGEDEPVSHRALGAGLYHFDAELGARRDTLSRQAVAAALADEALEEEKRVLYVLLTRAQDRLILIGTERRKRDTAEVRWAVSRDVPVRPHTFLDMIMPAVNNRDKVSWITAPGAFVPDRAPTEQAHADAEEVARLKAVFAWRYPHEGEAFVPVKLTASGLTRTITGAVDRTEIVRRPRFLQGSKRTGAERGTLYHQLLFALDLPALRGLSGQALIGAIDGQAAQLLARGLLAAPVDIGPVAAFFEGPVGARLLAASEVHREWPFNLRLSAQDALGAQAQTPVTVQGVIDCCFIEDGQWVLLDYKTDREGDENELNERYRAQLSLYRRALNQITGRPVKEALLCRITTHRTRC